MSPEWLPQSFLFLGGVFAAGLALHALVIGEYRQALRVGVASLALVAAAFALTQTKLTRLQGPRAKPIPLSMLVPATTTLSESERAAGDSMSLLLGDNLRLLVAPSKQYVFSFGRREFLTLDVQNRRMAVTCRLGDAQNRMIANIVRNNVRPAPGRSADAQSDRHTLLVRGANGDEALRIRYASPATIRITGCFHLGMLAEPITITSADGIHWPGGGLASEMTVSLTQYGQGTVDFEPSGLIQILP
jgi:hypothetical protein